MDINIYLHAIEDSAKADFLFGYSSGSLLVVLTFFAVLIALFGKVFWDRRYRPWLCIKIDKIRPYSIVVKQCFNRFSSDSNYSANNAPYVKVSDGTRDKQCLDDDCKTLYLRVGVGNYGRKDPAKKVEVFVKKIIPIDQNDKDCEPIEIAMNLKWSNVGDMRYPQILAKNERYCDVGSITMPIYRYIDPRYSSVKSHLKDDNPPAFCVNVTHPLSNGEHILRPGKYKIEVMVSAVGAEPVTGFIIIEFSDWSSTESEILKECKFDNDVVRNCDLWTYKISRFFKVYFSAFRP